MTITRRRAADPPERDLRCADPTSDVPRTTETRVTCALRGRGIAYDNKGDYDRAIRDFDEVLRLEPKYDYAVDHRDIINYNKNDYDWSLPLRVFSHDAQTFYHLGITYGHKSDYDRAIRDFDRAIRLDPLLAEAFYNRGIAYQYKGDFQHANQDFGQAIRLDPKLMEVVNHCSLSASTASVARSDGVSGATPSCPHPFAAFHPAPPESPAGDAWY